MKKNLRTIPFHSFFIGLYIILFIFIRNMSEVLFSSTYRSILIEFIVSLVLFGISYLIFRSARKAGIFLTFLLVGFFIYGILYNYTEALYYKGYWPFSHVHRFLVLVYFIGYAILFVILYRSKRPHYNFNYVLNVFVLAVFFMNIPMAFLQWKKQKLMKHQANPFLAINDKGCKDINVANDSFPDVYYIILDGYAAEKTLQVFYADKEPILYQYLRKKGFYVADSSRANYPFTDVSLSSSLNLGYHDSATQNTTATELIRDNTVDYVFKKAKYRIVNIESGYAVTENLSLADKTITTNALNEFENRLLGLTILRLDDVLGFSHYLRLKNELKQLKYFLKEKGPKFSFIHIVSPHPPYVVDSSGKRKVRTSISDMAWEPRKNYWQQLQYVSKSMIDFIDLLLSNSKQQPIIIIQSDHGPFIQDENPFNVYEARCRILNAYYAPDSIKNFLYPAITPVNSFRIIFSRLFQANYPVLPDRPIDYLKLQQDITFKSYTR